MDSDFEDWWDEYMRQEEIGDSLEAVARDAYYAGKAAMRDSE